MASLTATAVAAAAGDWLTVIDLPMDIIVGGGVAIGIIALAIGLFRARRAGRGRR